MQDASSLAWMPCNARARVGSTQGVAQRGGADRVGKEAHAVHNGRRALGAVLPRAVARRDGRGGNLRRVGEFAALHATMSQAARKGRDGEKSGL